MKIYEDCPIPSEYLGEGKTIKDAIDYFKSINHYVEIYQNDDTTYAFDFYTPRENGKIKAYYRWHIPDNSFDSPTKAYLGAIKFWFSLKE